MIRALAFLSSFASVFYHAGVGSIYALQPYARNSPGTYIDPCGILVLLTPQSPMMRAFTIAYLRALGVFMFVIGLTAFYEIFNELNFKPMGRLGFVHFVYMLLHLFQMRNFPATDNSSSSWFLFHLCLMLSLLQFKRFRYPAFENGANQPDFAVNSSETSTDEDYVPLQEDQKFGVSVAELVSSSTTTDDDDDASTAAQDVSSSSSPSSSSSSEPGEIVTRSRRQPQKLHTKQD